MNLSDFFNSKKAYQLFGLENEFNFLKELLIKDKFPNVLMLSGTKGSGKASLVTHLLSFYFDLILKYQEIQVPKMYQLVVFLIVFEHIE